jgi:ABC-type Fe3+/spermidine/putrescine transport system ATPase subunit
MLEVKNISFSYTQNNVIDSVDFVLPPGANLSVIGESGCGKSTLLKLIYGLMDTDRGEIRWNGQEVSGPKFNLIPGMPQMKYLAQDYDLMPYITVAENVGRYLSNTQKEYKEQRIDELLGMVEMLPFRDVKAKDLSGGQQQRVALAMVLAVEPELLLLDEPFSNIDSFRKGALRRNLFAYLKSKNITCIIATHDSIDSLSFADYTLAMKNGQIVQFDQSEIVYRKPYDKYVASLFGEVNQIMLSDLDAAGDKQKSILLYASDLYLTDDSDFIVQVKQCYLKGSNYLVKAVTERRLIFFECPFSIPINEFVCITADPEVIALRSRQ